MIHKIYKQELDQWLRVRNLLRMELALKTYLWSQDKKFIEIAKWFGSEAKQLKNAK